MSHARAGIELAWLVCAAALLSCSSDAAYTVEATRVDTPTGTLHGTSVLPSGPGPHPVVLILAGSGPTDREGNSAVLAGSNDSLRLLAEGLAQHGVASVRYDKRGVAESAVAAPREEELRLDTYVDDAVAWLDMIDADPRFASTSVLGHSEGSLIGMLAVARTGAQAFISVAGTSRRGSEVLRDQLRTRLPRDLWSESEQILAALEAGTIVADVPEALAALYRPSVQPYLISWLRYVPAEELKRLAVPVLIAQGTTDTQVAVSDAEGLHAAKPEAELLILEGMNHVLKLVPAQPEQQLASYTDPSLPIDAELVQAVARFVRR